MQSLRYLESCSLGEIEAVVKEVVQRPTDELEKEILTVQSYAANAFSRKAFRSTMVRAIGKALESL